MIRKSTSLALAALLATAFALAGCGEPPDNVGEGEDTMNEDGAE